jgi:hypothetical protein
MASWADIGQIYTGNQCYVHGQRTVGLVYARNDSLAEDAEEETTRIHSLVIFDFDPVRVKQASRQIRRGVRISDPKAESAWEIPADETRIMKDLFLGGEAKADAPFSVRTTLINEEFHSPYCYVMMDEEHGKSVYLRLYQCPDAYIPFSCHCISKYDRDSIGLILIRVGLYSRI